MKKTIQTTTNSTPFFIVGVPRSGTTLLRSLLCEHPLIAIPPETHFICTWIPKYSSAMKCWEDYSLQKEFLSLGIDVRKVNMRIDQDQITPNAFHKVFNSILTEYAESKGKTIIGEKTPGNYEHLKTIFSWYPACKVIWIVRDPRALCASYLKTPWSKGNVLIPAFRWRKSIDLLNGLIPDPRILYIKYEELILNTENTIERVWEFLGEKPIIINFSSRDRLPSKEKSVNEWEHGHLEAASKAITSQPLTKWEADLTPNEIELIEYVTQSGMRQMNYTRSTKKQQVRKTPPLGMLLWQLANNPRIILTSLRNKTLRMTSLK